MELRVLRYFLAVAREESISGAAEQLHLTQPTLSRQLMDLEEELGKKLLIRGNRRVTLTEDGLLLRRRAGEILELVEKTESELRKQDETVSGDIYIGAGETDAMRLIAHAAGALQAIHPLVRFHLFSGNGDDVTERLDRGLLDFGILIDPINVQKYDSCRLPVTDTWGLLMKKDSPLAQKQAVEAEDLLSIPILTSRQAMVSEHLSAWMKRDFSALNIIATYNLIYNAALMVEEGMGYALTLDKLVNTTGDSPLCFRPLRPRLDVGLYIVWKKYQVFSDAAEKFLDLLRERIL